MEKRQSGGRPSDKPQKSNNQRSGSAASQKQNRPPNRPPNRPTQSVNTQKRPPNRPVQSSNTQKSKNFSTNPQPNKPRSSQQQKTVHKPTSSQQNLQKNNTQYQKPKQQRLPQKKPVQQRSISQADVDIQAEEILNKPRKLTRQQEYSKPLAPAKEPISPYKRKMKRVLFYMVTIVILFAVCCVLSLTVFFKIDNIEVEGKTRYEKDDIISSCLINKGDNLILCNTGSGEDRIKNDFPYIEEVSIEKKLFNTIIITVTEAKPTSVIESKGQYVVLGKTGKIIEIDKEKKYSVPTVLGAELEKVKLSSTVKYKDDNVSKYVDDILAAVSETGIKNIETVDISNLSKITLIRKNGFKIIIGTPEDVEYKLRTAKAIMDGNVKDSDSTGVLDVSLASADGGKSYLKDGASAESSVQSSKPENSKTESSKPESSKTEESSSAESSGETSSEPSDESSEETSQESSAESSEETSQESSDESSEDTSSEPSEESSEETGE
ncbi:MAG: FtsQ-type POTRA domain-containing protein [Clostridia bacterium]|nr:FtsQ-type POTRA domain-containing protein [Clostridia bacterium]